MRAPRLLASLLVVLGLSAAALLAPGIASAQLIFDHGNDIWAANDDGSGAHPLVLAAPLGMDAGLGSPAVAPDGDALLFRGTTLRNAVAGHSQNFYGENADGVYELRGGVVRRLSAPPVAGPLAWTTGDIEPEPGPGGSYVYERDQCTEIQIFTEFGFFWDPFCVSKLRSSSLAAGAAGSAPFGTSCDEDAEGGPADPSPDPASGSLLVAYVGCETEAGSAGLSRGELVVSGPGRSGEAAIAYGPEIPYDEATTAFADPSWSPDGSRLLLFDHGGTDYTDTPEQAAGIYVLEPMPSPTTARLVVLAPEVGSQEYETLASPRFVGPSTIAFVAGGSVWTAPLSCEACSLGSGATKLVPGGSTPAEQAFSVTWTGASVAPASVYPGQAQGAGSPGSGSSSPPAPGPARKHGSERARALGLTLRAGHAPRLRKLLAKGLPVKARCSRRCSLVLTLTIDAKTARRYGLARRGRSPRRRAMALLRRRGSHGAVVVGRARLKLRAGRMTGTRVRFTRKARRALRRARGLKLRLSGVARARHLAPATVGRVVKVRR